MAALNLLQLEEASAPHILIFLMAIYKWSYDFIFIALISHLTFSYLSISTCTYLFPATVYNNISNNNNNNIHPGCPHYQGVFSGALKITIKKGEDEESENTLKV